MTLTVPRPPSVATSAPATSIVSALARFEAKRAATHPLSWIGVAGSLWLMWTWFGRVAPVLERDSIFVAGSLMPLAATTGLVTFYASLRDRSNSELSDALPVGENQRTLALAASTVGPLILALLLTAAGVTYLLTGSPIGSLDWLELAAGPAMVVLFGVGGVLLATLFPHPVAGPLALLIVGYLQALASPDASLFSGIPSTNIEWLAPWMPPATYVPVGELRDRPDLFHLVGLGAMTAVFVVGAIRGRRSLWARVVGIAVLVAGLALASNAIEPFVGSSFDWVAASEDQMCESRDGIDYCHYPGYEDWVDRWQQTISQVSATAPATLERVVQRPSFISWSPDVSLGDPSVAAVTRQSWDRPGVRPDKAFALAMKASGTAIGLPAAIQLRPYTEEEIAAATIGEPEPEVIEEAMRAEGVPFSCSAIDQARGAVSVWFAASALEGGEAALAKSLNTNRTWTWPGSVADWFDPPAFLGAQSGELALAMLALPVDDVRATIFDRWDEIRDPSTSLGDLAGWLDLPAPVATTPELGNNPACQ